MSRYLVATLLVAGIGIAPVRAQESQSVSSRPLWFAGAADTITPVPPLANAPQAAVPTNKQAVALTDGIVPVAPPKDRALTLNMLCVSFAALQVADLHTTFSALNNGAQEGNPVLGGFASNKAAMVTVKAATTVTTIYLARKLGVRNRVAATILMGAVNSAYAMIAVHNYRVANSLK